MQLRIVAVCCVHMPDYEAISDPVTWHHSISTTYKPWQLQNGRTIAVLASKSSPISYQIPKCSFNFLSLLPNGSFVKLRAV